MLLAHLQPQVVHRPLCCGATLRRLKVRKQHAGDGCYCVVRIASDNKAVVARTLARTFQCLCLFVRGVRGRPSRKNPLQHVACDTPTFPEQGPNKWRGVRPSNSSLPLNNEPRRCTVRHMQRASAQATCCRWVAACCLRA